MVNITADADRAERLHVANTILQQLGGRRFMVMTGATSVLTLGAPELGVSFRLPLKRKGPNYWRIVYEPGPDTYRIELFYVRNRERTILKTLTDIYADQLVDIFERETGLVTKL